MPHGFMPISDEPDSPETALEWALRSSDELKGAAHNPKVAASNPAPAILRFSSSTSTVQAARLLGRFAETLLELRLLSGRSQLEVAVHAGIHRTEVCVLERADRMPRLDTLLKVAAGVDADPAALMEGLFWTLQQGPIPTPLPRTRSHLSSPG